MPRWRALSWLPVAAWAGLIFALSAQPNLRFVEDADLDFVVRKAGHMAVFGMLALLLWLALAQTPGLRRPWAWGLLLAALYAVTDELHQGMVAGRHPAVLDVAIDATGALLFVVGALLVIRWRRNATLGANAYPLASTHHNM